MTVVAAYPKQVKVLQTVNATTLRALAANPNDVSAQASAASQLSGIPVATVAQVLTIEQAYPSQIATGKVIDREDRRRAAQGSDEPCRVRNRREGDRQGVRHLHHSRDPSADSPSARYRRRTWRLSKSDGPKLLIAQAELESVSAMPAADLKLLETQATKVQKIADAYPAADRGPRSRQPGDDE
jgi:hypothetical protein